MPGFATPLLPPMALAGAAGSGGGGELEAIVRLMARTKNLLVNALADPPAAHDLVARMEEIAAAIEDLQARVAALEAA